VASSPYQQLTLQQFTTLISTLLDDTAARYWTIQEITYAVQEALYVWGALANYWRARGTFQASPTDQTPWYDLSVLCPTLRTRALAPISVYTEMAYHLLEEPLPLFFGQGSGQVTIAVIAEAVDRALNRFLMDTHLPYAVTTLGGPPPPDGQFTFSPKVVYVHRVGWKDSRSGVWTPLWRDDAWGIDRGNPSWTTEPGSPTEYSMAETAPLTLQLAPPPGNSGICEAITVNSLVPSITGTFGLPDEWVHAVKYSALADVLSADSQINDPLRAKYCEQRYQQSVAFAQEARSVFRVLANGTPLALDTLGALDAGLPYWRNQPQPPFIGATVYDMVVIPPVTSVTGIGVDLSQSAPIPMVSTDWIPLGYEDVEHITEYVLSYLLLKCGGNEFTGSLSGYDSFMSAVAGRKDVNRALVRYLVPLFQMPNQDQGYRPDRVPETQGAR
jgi:hypothetical protein